MGWFQVFAVMLLKWMLMWMVEAQSGFPDNPCPHIFQYLHDGRLWYGSISLPTTDVRSSDVSIHVTLSVRASIVSNRSMRSSSIFFHCPAVVRMSDMLLFFFVWVFLVWPMLLLLIFVCLQKRNSSCHASLSGFDSVLVLS